IFKRPKSPWGLALLMITAELMAQQPSNDLQSLFGPFMDRQGTAYRTASGAPGPEYWQNAADYTIEAQLEETSGTLSGHVQILYTNNSPQALEFVWLSLEQNRFTETSRGTLTTPIGGNRY